MKPSRILSGLALLSPALNGTLATTVKPASSATSTRTTALAPTADGTAAIGPRATRPVDSTHIGHRIGHGLSQLRSRVGQLLPAYPSTLQQRQVSSNRAGRAAQAFQKKFASSVLRQPEGTVRASRGDLGFQPGDVAMLDLGGEGQKTDNLYEGAPLRSGNRHAINVNAMEKLSPGLYVLELDEGKDGVEVNGAPIPNLMRIKGEWPEKTVQEATGLVPVEDGFSDLTVMENAPLRPYHLQELGRITAGDGWIVLTLDAEEKPALERLAAKHNGGVLWELPPQRDADTPRFVIPPASVKDADAPAYQALFVSSTSHEVYDVVQGIRLHQAGLCQVPSLDEARRHADAQGEVDVAALLADSAGAARRNEL